MVNNKNKSKLDEVIKQTLSSYEAPYNSSDWEQMERILDAAPKSKSFRYKHNLLSIFESAKTVPKSKSAKWIFSPYFLIILILVGGAYFLYTIINSSKTPENSIDSALQNTVDSINSDTLKTTILPTIPQDVLKVENKTELTKDTIKISTNDKTSVKATETEPVKKENIIQKETNVIEKSDIKKIDKTKIDKRKDSIKAEPVFQKENPPSLIVVPDSSGRESKEKKETDQIQKEDKKLPDNHLGRNSFLLQKINADSIQKRGNLSPTDSLKGPK